eukprot:208612_1
MLNLVILSLGIVASKADLSCNGVSVVTDWTYFSIPAGVCMAVISESRKSSFQLVCKGGKIHIDQYTSSGDCTGDFTEHEYCSVSHWSNCTSVCDQDPCEYIKEVVYSGVTSCDPIVVSSSRNVGYHITGQCRPSFLFNQSTSMLCDSSSGIAQYVMYTSYDCTGPPILSWNLATTCSVDNDHALTYSCGTANDVHTPETTIEEVKGNID